MSEERAVKTIAPGGRPRLIARYAQMTHASFDDPDDVSGGGWQVKQVSPGVSDEERARLRAAVSTSFYLAHPMSAYPGRDEIDALPRRLVLNVEADGSGLYSHTCAAGDDATGRPGNVFSHVVLDRLLVDVLEQGAPDRPVQMWRSPAWLTPFGPREVLASEVRDNQPPAYDGPLDRLGILQFLFDSEHYRFATFALLLDGIAQALGGGPAVVLVADTVDEGVSWIAAASFFAAPATCARLTFSTYARVTDLLDQVALPMLNVVLREDLAAYPTIKKGSLLLVDPLDETESENVDGVEVRRTRYGSIVPATYWSALALDLCATDVRQVDERLSAMDVLAVEAGIKPWHCAWWALAVSVAQAPQLVLYWPTAAAVVLSQTPAEVPLQGEVGSALVRLLRSCAGRSAEEAWNLLGSHQHGPSSAGLLDLAREVYLEQAFTDWHWLTAPDAPPLQGQVQDAAAVVRLHEVVEQSAERLLAKTQECEEHEVAALRLLDLAVCSGTVKPQRQEGMLGSLVKWLATVLNDSSQGRRLVRRCAPLAEETVRGVLAADLALHVAATPEPPGERLSHEVLDWLSDGYGRLTAFSNDALEQELIVARCRRNNCPDMRGAAAVALLQSSWWLPEAPPADRARRGLTSVQGSETWTAAELTQIVNLVGRAPGIDLVPIVSTWLYGKEPTQQTQELARSALAASGGRPGWGVFGTRDELLLNVYKRLSPGWQLAAVSDPDDVLAMLHAGMALSSEAGGGPVVEEVLAAHLLAAVLLLAVLSGAGLAVVNQEQVCWLDSVEGLEELVVKPSASRAIRLLDEVVAEAQFRRYLTDILVRELLIGGPDRNCWAGASRILLGRDSAKAAGFERTLGEDLLRRYWARRGSEACLAERERVAAKFRFRTKEKRSDLNSWWLQFLPAARKTRWPSLRSYKWT